MQAPSMDTAGVGGDDGGTCSVSGAGRTLPSTSSVACRLSARLAETARLMGEFEREQQQHGVADLNVYKQCCRQLVTYMATHMDTSEGFVQRMDTIIEVSHSDSGEFTLRELVAGDLWVRYGGNSSAESGVQATSVPSTPAPRGPTIKTDTGAIAVTPLAVANATVGGLRPTCSPHVDLTVSSSPIVGRGGKRQSKRGTLFLQETKRSRHTVARNLYGAGILNGEEKEEESEPTSTKDSETETETEVEEQGVQATHLQHGVSGGGIVWPCAGDRPSERSPAYKQRLKSAVKLVDAENCCPPPGTVCTHGCCGVRARMCETHRTQGGSAMPCHNGMCCVWREIDTHIVRCQNSQCEFKNVVGLRQTMHNIQQHELKLETTSTKLLASKAMLRDVDCEEAGSRGRRGGELESKIKSLEKECVKLEDAILLHKDRERAFKFDLKTLDTPSSISDPDELPSFQSHYARKRSRE